MHTNKFGVSQNSDSSDCDLLGCNTAQYSNCTYFEGTRRIHLHIVGTWLTSETPPFFRTIPHINFLCHWLYVATESLKYSLDLTFTVLIGSSVFPARLKDILLANETVGIDLQPVLSSRDVTQGVRDENLGYLFFSGCSRNGIPYSCIWLQ